MLSLEDFYDHNEMVRNDMLSLEQEIVLLDTILALKESGVGLESALPVIAASVNMANIGTTGSVSDEVLKRYYNLSTEGITESVGAIGNKISLVFKNHIDTLTSLLTWWTSHSVEIKELASIASKMNRPVTISVPNNKYLKYGENKTVTDFKDYVKAFSVMTDYMVSVNKELDKFTKDDFFSSIKALFSVVTGYNDFYEKMHSRLNSLTSNIISSQSYSKIDQQTHVSPSLLGLTRISVTAPDKKAVSIEQKKKQSNAFYVWVKRDEKFEVGSDGMVEFTVDAASLKELAKLCDKLVESYLPMMSLKSKFSTFGAKSIVNNFAAMIPASPISSVARLFLANYRIMLNSSAIIYTATSSGFVFSRGNVEKVISIKEKVRKQL